MERFFAIVNPAAGGGRSAKLAGPALVRLREGGIAPGDIGAERRHILADRRYHSFEQPK